MPLRVIGSLERNDQIMVYPYNEGLVKVWDGQKFNELECPTVAFIDLNDCTIDGVRSSAQLGQTYYVYAYDAGGLRLAFDLSQTGPQPAYLGHMIKSADASRSLIGGFHYDIHTKLGLGGQNNNTGSWYARGDINPSVYISGGGDRTGNWQILTTPQTRITAWVWGDYVEPLVLLTGMVANAQVGNPSYVGIFQDYDTRKTADEVAIFTSAHPDQCVSVAAVWPCNAINGGFHTWDVGIRTERAGGHAYVNNHLRLTLKYSNSG